MFGEKAWLELKEETAYCFEQILEAVPKNIS